GSTNRPYRAFTSVKPAAAQNGKRGFTTPITPPIAGPITKPSPHAAPIIPKLAARFSGGVTSATYAPAVGKLAAVIPEITRPTNSHHNVGPAPSGCNQAPARSTRSGSPPGGQTDPKARRAQVKRKTASAPRPCRIGRRFQPPALYCRPESLRPVSAARG